MTNSYSNRLKGVMCAGSKGDDLAGCRYLVAHICHGFLARRRECCEPGHFYVEQLAGGGYDGRGSDPHGSSDARGASLPAPTLEPSILFEGNLPGYSLMFAVRQDIA